MLRSLPAVLSLLALAPVAWCDSVSDINPDRPLLVRHPTISRTQIVFVFANDLWGVSREGGEAKRIAAGVGVETDPIFSPDGSQIAFTGEYDGNVDVFVIPAEGGTPRRLTYHPATDRAIGWTPDGKNVVFGSGRTSYSSFTRLFTVPVTGGFETQLPLDRAVMGSYSPDGTKLAYVPTDQWQRAWKRYRGGQTTPIWIATLSDSSIVKVPRSNSNDFDPMWVGDTIYFLSDRAGAVSLFAYDTKTKQVAEAVKNDGLDFKYASAGPDAIVIEQFGSLVVYDLKTRKTHSVKVRLNGDLSEVRPHFRKIQPNEIRAAGISPSGARAVFAAHGEIFTVPAEKGDIRNLTRTVAVEERDPAWSPDGKSVAYFSDASGEYQLEIRDQSGMGEAKRIGLGGPVFPHQPVWSPDSKKIVYTDQALNVCYVDMEGIFGPKVMVTNEMAGSGGDALPWMFRKTGIGPLVGTRTWGGLVGHYTTAGDLIDGGSVASPDLGFYNLDGSWDVENHGVTPDYEVEMDPKLVREGKDPQLEKAVEVALEQLRKNTVNYGKRPPYPDYHNK